MACEFTSGGDEPSNTAARRWAARAINGTDSTIGWIETTGGTARDSVTGAGFEL